VKELIPTEGVESVIRLQLDAQSIALQAYYRAWLKARAESRPLPEPPRIPPGPVIRIDVIKRI
jgi:hypothetical protein